MVNAYVIHCARANGSSGGQFVPAGGRAINVERVVDILVAADRSAGHPSVRRSAGAVLDAMATKAWRVTAAPHTGGVGGGDYRPDFNLHVSLQVRGRGYHLQLTKDLVLRRITGDDGVDLIPPWIAPGAAFKLP